MFRILSWKDMGRCRDEQQWNPEKLAVPWLKSDVAHRSIITCSLDALAEESISGFPSARPSENEKSRPQQGWGYGTRLCSMGRWALVIRLITMRHKNIIIGVAGARKDLNMYIHHWFTWSTRHDPNMCCDRLTDRFLNLRKDLRVFRFLIIL